MTRKRWRYINDMRTTTEGPQRTEGMKAFLSDECDWTMRGVRMRNERIQARRRQDKRETATKREKDQEDLVSEKGTIGRRLTTTTRTPAASPPAVGGS